METPIQLWRGAISSQLHKNCSARGTCRRLGRLPPMATVGLPSGYRRATLGLPQGYAAPPQGYCRATAGLLPGYFRATAGLPQGYRRQSLRSLWATLGRPQGNPRAPQTPSGPCQAWFWPISEPFGTPGKNCRPMAYAPSHFFRQKQGPPIHRALPSGSHVPRNASPTIPELHEH